ncbi:unnamed protein product [Rotaria sp. Silwood1]|nr:unnamed protein product [Rotaria sp. Silwood1]
MERFDSFSSLDLDNGGTIAVDLATLMPMPNLGDFSSIPDLRLHLPARVTVYLRITRITLKHDTSDLFLLHPYPIWIRHNHAKVHGGSLLIPVTEQDFKNGYITIENLVMIRLTQPDLAKMKTFAIYSPTQLSCTGGKKIVHCTERIELFNRF